ncbi:MAG TPA: tetratricopeptide repeat protein [Planctomycetota bacterium]|nr:tetratricopeptide repeat protein [Planctomycetota bacterium]
MSRTTVLAVALLAGCASAAHKPVDDLDEYYASTSLHGIHRDFDEVRAALTEVHAGLRANPGWAEGWFRRANILESSGFREMALKSYDKAIGLNPEYVDALLARGMLRVDGGSEKDFEAVIKAAPKAPDGYLMRAWLERKEGRYSESERDLAEARARGPGRWEDYHNAGVAAHRAGRLRAAEQNFNLSVLLRPDNADGWLALSSIHAATGRTEKALDDLNQAETARPGDASIWYARAEILRSLGRSDEAIRAYDVALKLGPVPIMHAGRGQARDLAKDVQGAEADFTRALEMDPNLRDAWVARARLRARAGRYEEARDDFAVALRIRASATVLREFGRLHHDKELWGHAVAAYESALRLCDEPSLKALIERDLADARAKRK